MSDIRIEDLASRGTITEQQADGLSQLREIWLQAGQQQSVKTAGPARDGCRGAPVNGFSMAAAARSRWHKLSEAVSRAVSSDMPLRVAVMVACQDMAIRDVAASTQRPTRQIRADLQRVGDIVLSWLRSH